VAETKEKIRLRFLAHLRLNLVLGSAKRLNHGLSQTVKSPSISWCTQYRGAPLWAEWRRRKLNDATALAHDISLPCHSVLVNQLSVRPPKLQLSHFLLLCILTTYSLHVRTWSNLNVFAMARHYWTWQTARRRHHIIIIRIFKVA